MNALREALLRGKRRPRHAGAGSPTIYRGDGYEFVELREYVPGDDVRRIDWAASARSAQLQTRVVLEDVAVTLCAIADTSDSMLAGRGRSLLACAQEAAAAFRECAQRGDRVRDLPLDSPFELLGALQAALAVLPRGTALLVASDFWDLPSDDDLIVRLGLRFDCTALLGRDPWYDALPLRGFVRLRDAETGATERLFVGKRERERYAAAVRAREGDLFERFARANWRTGVLHESDGRASVLHAFGIT